MVRVRVRVRGVAADRAARHADAAAAKPDRERSLVIRRRWVALLLTILGAVGWYVHASTHRVLLHRPLHDAEHYEGQAGAAELDAGRSAPKSHPTMRWLHLPAECKVNLRIEYLRQVLTAALGAIVSVQNADDYLWSADALCRN